MNPAALCAARKRSGPCAAASPCAASQCCVAVCCAAAEKCRCTPCAVHGNQEVKKKADYQQMQKEKTANLMKDLGKALLLGLGVGSAVFLPAFLIGLAMNGLAGGLETAKNVLMATGAILLFILAGMILIKGKKNSRFNMEENGWRRHFKVIGPTPVIALFAGSFLAISFIADYIQWMLY